MKFIVFIMKLILKIQVYVENKKMKHNSTQKYNKPNLEVSNFTFFAKICIFVVESSNKPFLRFKWLFHVSGISLSENGLNTKTCAQRERERDRQTDRQTDRFPPTFLFACFLLLVDAVSHELVQKEGEFEFQWKIK